MTASYGCFAWQTSEEQPEKRDHPAVFQSAEPSAVEDLRGGRDCRWLIIRCKNSKNSQTHRAAAKRNRRPRESGGPEPAPGLNRGQPAKGSPWIPACAQGCPGKSDISQSELVLNIERGLQGGWGFVEVGDGSVFEQTSAHRVCKAQCDQPGAPA